MKYMQFCTCFIFCTISVIWHMEIELLYDMHFKQIYLFHIWAPTREKLSSDFANNKGADQSAHPRSLISAYLFAYSNVFYLNLLRASEILIFWLFTVAEEAGFVMTWSETLKTGFIASWPTYMYS